MTNALLRRLLHQKEWNYVRSDADLGPRPGIPYVGQLNETQRQVIHNLVLVLKTSLIMMFVGHQKGFIVCQSGRGAPSIYQIVVSILRQNLREECIFQGPRNRKHCSENRWPSEFRDFRGFFGEQLSESRSSTSKFPNAICLLQRSEHQLGLCRKTRESFGGDGRVWQVSWVLG